MRTAARSRSPAVTPVRPARVGLPAPPPLTGASPRPTSPSGPTSKQRKDFAIAARKPGDAIFVNPDEAVPSGPGIPEGDPGLLRVEAELRRVTELLREELSRAEKPTPEDFGIPEDVPSKGELCCVEKLVRVCNEDYKKELLRIKAEFHGRELEAEAALRKAKEDYETRELNILAAGESKRKERPATTLAKKHGGGGGGGGSVVVEVAAPVQAPAPAPEPKPGS
eukprot:COSAG02_NODE_17627_length_990_cov_1.278339_1_plen_223_part_10